MSLKDDIESFIPEVEQHVRSWFEARAPQIDRGVKLAEMADANPAMQVLMTAAGITPAAHAAIGEFLAKLDAEFQRVAAEAHEAGRLAGHAAAAAELAPPAAEVPAEGEQPAGAPPAE